MTNIKCLPLGRGGRLLTCVLLLSAPAPAMGQDLWTLDASVRRILDIAPENRGAEAEVEARRGALRQAGAWPNPTIELRGDDKIGKDEGVGGVDLTQFVLSQPLPLSGRIGHRRAVAKAELSSARAAQKYQQLLLETEAARHFHALQLAGARLNLAQQRLQLADELQNAGRRRQESGELAQLDRLRLDLLREAAQQILDVAEGGYNEALSRFRTSLGLPAAHVPRLAPLEHFGPIPDLARLRVALSEHPALDATRRRVGAKRSEVELLRSERLPDPVLRFYSERDFLNGRRQNVIGIGIAVTVPLWDLKSGRISEARARANKAQFQLQALERDLSGRLEQNHLHLTHLVGQGENHRVRVFEPAREVFELTRKAYAGGEVGILSLIDANNTYFDAFGRYLELLQEAWLEAAELRLAAGQSLIPTGRGGQS